MTVETHSSTRPKNNSSWTLPMPSMYGIYLYTYIYHKDQPNVGKYTIHGWYGLDFVCCRIHWLGESCCQKLSSMKQLLGCLQNASPLTSRSCDRRWGIRRIYRTMVVISSMTDPWERHISQHEWLIFMVNVGYIMFHRWSIWVPEFLNFAITHLNII